MEKKEVRKLVLTKLKKLAKQPETKEKKERLLIDSLFASDIWKASKVVAVTLNMSYEFETREIIKRAWIEKKQVGVPKTYPESKMEFIEITFGTIYEKTPFGVNEPVKGAIIKQSNIDLMIVPGVAFRQDGYRVGFGGGFYDRYLSNYKGVTCSLVFSEQRYDDWNPSKFDLPVTQLFIDQIPEI